MNALYTPNQVLAASLIGGPLAALYTLYQNSKSLQQAQRQQQLTTLGVPLVLLLLSISPFAKDLAFQFFIPLAYSLAARTICVQWHQPALLSGSFTPHTLRSVIRTCLFGLLAIMFASVIWLSLMASMGIVDLEELEREAQSRSQQISEPSSTQDPATRNGDRFGGFD